MSDGVYPYAQGVAAFHSSLIIYVFRGILEAVCG